MLIRNEGEDQMLTKEGEGNPPRTQPLQKYRFLIVVMSIALLVAALGAGVKFQQVHGAHADSPMQCPSSISVSLTIFPYSSDSHPTGSSERNYILVKVSDTNNGGANSGESATAAGTAYGPGDVSQTWAGSTQNTSVIDLTVGTNYTFAGNADVTTSVDPATGNETTCGVTINQSFTAQ